MFTCGSCESQGSSAVRVPFTDLLERTSTHPGYSGDPWLFRKPWLCAVPEPSATGEFLRAGCQDLDSSR